ncbi:MAG: exodeoxyribonuclease VII small subunit [Clostridia bacterium]|mgnify:CR=1 FL=1|nr:exodeoxyribonuclease VII small subunit [Clostridia bacterium]
MAEEKKLTYEEAMIRLEAIVKSLEQDTLNLEDSLKLFEEGTKLAGFCNKTLDEAELKITSLNDASEGDAE